MQIYFAPMEGITDSTFRSLHHRFFPGVDRYYTPFLSPTIHKKLTPKECRDLPLADTLPFVTVPQILCKIPDNFLWAAQECADRGYREVNLNAGCPSGTVVSKGKGAGMLRNPDDLDSFLYTVFKSTPLPVSVKTRLGMEDPGEFREIMEVYNRYPIRELIVHPRVQKALYRGKPDMEQFRYCTEHAAMPICYNGNLNSLADIEAFRAEFPSVQAVMIGRGLVGDPGMLVPGGSTPETLEAFYNALLEAYIELFGSERNAMFRLKENWHYLLRRFEGTEKLGKKLRKTTDIEEDRQITAEIFRTCPLAPCLQADW